MLPFIKTGEIQILKKVKWNTKTFDWLDIVREKTYASDAS